MNFNKWGVLYPCESGLFHAYFVRAINQRGMVCTMTTDPGAAALFGTQEEAEAIATMYPRLWDSGFPTGYGKAKPVEFVAR